MIQSMKFAILSVAALAVTGCAQLGAAGDFAWNTTENTASFFFKPVASLLRPAPEQTYVFDATQDYDVILYEPPVQTKAFAEGPPPQIDKVEVETTGTGYYTSEPLPSIPDISFAKIGGGSNMQDWLACEEKAGGYLYWEAGKGYALDPTFESCMRGMDYALESEIAQNNSAL